MGVATRIGLNLLSTIECVIYWTVSMFPKSIFLCGALYQSRERSAPLTFESLKA